MQEKQPSHTGKGKKLALHKAAHDPRAATLVALASVLDNGVASQQALDTALSTTLMVPTDKRLCTELLYGSLRHYNRLWWFAARSLPKPEKLPAEMRLVLVLALYEMTFLRIPHHASLGWAVSHIRHRFGLGLSKVCNGALRTMQRRLRDFHRKEFYATEAASHTGYLATFYSCPEWLVSLWCTAYGEIETEILLQQSLEAAPSGLRLNVQAAGWADQLKELQETSLRVKKLSPHLAKYAKDNLEFEKAQGEAQEGNNLDKPNDIVNATTAQASPKGTAQAEPTGVAQAEPTGVAQAEAAQIIAVGKAGLAFFAAMPWVRGLEKKGVASRQSMASYQMLMRLKPDTWPKPIWDACAGRGGKSLPLLEMGIPVALATDPAEGRLQSYAAEYERLQLQNPARPVLALCPAADVLTSDTLRIYTEAKTFEPMPTQELPEKFGCVLLDAPCSGFGTLAKRPEIKYRRTPEDVAGLIKTQAELLDAAAKKLKDGGLLIYITCTLNPAENGGQIAAFLQKHPKMKLLEEIEDKSQAEFREFFYAAKLQKMSKQ